MQEGELHGFAGGFHGAALAHRRFHELGHRLDDAIENQIDTDAGGEQHRRPGNDIEFRFGMVRPQFDRAVARAGDGDHEHQVSHHGEKVEPAEAVGDPGQRRVDHGARRFGEEHRPQGEYENGQARAVKNDRVDTVLLIQGFRFLGRR